MCQKGGWGLAFGGEGIKIWWGVFSGRGSKFLAGGSTNRIGELRIWNFQRYLGNSNWIFQGIN